MQAEYPNERTITEEEIRELEEIRSTIEKAIEDGFLSRVEFDRIKGQIFHTGITTVAQLRRESDLYRHLVSEKIYTGELIAEPPQ
jgi:DNA-binding GntR family transcriptional regulator